MIYECQCIFDKNKYDPKIDFVKGFCIISVIVNHCVDNLGVILFPLWGGPAVSLFILIQVFHAYKGKVAFPQTRKLWNRIIKRFLLIQLLLLLVWILFSDVSFITQLKLFLYRGGHGPGSYYVWVYLQISFLLPLFYPLLKVTSFLGKLILFIFLSELMELFFCLFHIPSYLYVLLCFRYIFLIYLGYLMVNFSFVISKRTLLFAFLSLISLLLFSYSGLSFFPFFYNHPFFTTCHWPCYYYVYLMLLFLLIIIYDFFSIHIPKILNVICVFGKKSYSIFLLQMVYFSIMDVFPMKKWLEYRIDSIFFSGFLYVLLSLIVCLFPFLLMTKSNDIE